MRKYFSILIFLIAGSIFAQTLPETVTNRAKLARWVREGTFTFDNKSFAAGSETYFVSDADTLRFDLSTALYPIDLEIGNTRKFGVDSTGKIIGPNEGTISNVTNGSWILLEASEDLNFAFSNNALDLSSSTGVSAVDFQVLDINTDYLKVFKPTVDATDYVQLDPYTDLQVLDIYVNNASIFNIDSTGLITGPSAGVLNNATDNAWTLTENSENLTITFGATDFDVSSSTGPTTVDFGALAVRADYLEILQPTVDATDIVIIDPYKDLQVFDIQINGASKFNVDSTGVITGPQAGTLDNTSDNMWTIGENSETVTFGFTSSDFDVSSSSGITVADFGTLDLQSDYVKVFKPTVDATDMVLLDPYTDLHVIDAQVNGASIFNVDSTGTVYMQDVAIYESTVDATDKVLLDPYDDLHVLDLQIGGATIFNVDSTGIVNTAGDITMANGKVIKGDVTTAHTISLQVYDNNTGPGYKDAILLTNGDIPAIAIGDGNPTVAVNSSDWDISTTGVVTGLGNVTSDGQALFTDFKDVGDNGTTFLATGGDSLTAANTVGNINYSVFTFTNTNCRITMTDAAAAGCHGSFKLADLPAGAIKIIGSVVTLTVTAGAGGIVDDATYDIGVGSTQVAVDNEELAATEQDIVAKIEGDLAGGTKAIQAQSGTDALIDGTGTDADMWLNVAIAAADASANDLLNVQGTIKIVWVALGDY